MCLLIYTCGTVEAFYNNVDLEWDGKRFMKSK